MAVKMYEKYEKLMASGKYDSIEEMCNELGLNYSDLYYDDKDDEYYKKKNSRRKTW